jgi:hypothetical protein
MLVPIPILGIRYANFIDLLGYSDVSGIIECHHAWMHGLKVTQY